jgi:NAD(P)-dependent dehydrogenase (short-subunit alcohol dehydrogenase family)
MLATLRHFVCDSVFMSKPIALITGAGRGIGRATSIQLAGHGYQLLLTSRTKSELAETARQAGGATILAGDVTSPRHAMRLISKVKALRAPLEVLVNNAGYAPAYSIDKMPLEEWDKILATNLSAVFYLCKYAWPIFVKQKRGVIVNISSAASRDPFPGLGAYGAAKAALNLFSLDLARQGKPHGIHVYTLELGAVETKMLRELVTQKQLPPEQTLDPAEVASAIYSCIAGRRRNMNGKLIYLQK